MKMTPLRKIALTATYMLCVFIGASPAYAITAFVQQTLDSTSENPPSNGNFFQRLGNGYSGLAQQFDVEAQFAAAAGSATYRAYMAHCDDSSYTTNCNTDVDSGTDNTFTIPAGGITKQIFDYSTTTGIILDPTKYYYIGLAFSSGTSHTVTAYGAGSNVFSGGACVNASGTTLATVIDCYFDFGGTLTQSDRSYVSNLQPSTGSTTSQANVHISFNTHNVSSDNIQNYLLSFTDKVTNSNFTLTGPVAGGDANVSRVVPLTSGHFYSLIVGLESPTAIIGNTQAVGFWVVSSSTPIVAGVGNFSTTTTSFGTTTGSNVGTIDTSKIIPDALYNLLHSKFPFSYVFDTVTLLNELASGTSADDATFTFPLGAQLSNGSTTFKVIDKQAIANTGYITGIRNVVSMGLYFTTGIYLMGAVMGAF